MDTSTSTTLADAGFTRPSDISPTDFFHKYQIPMYILFSTIAILILGCTLWLCCSRKKKKSAQDLEDLEFQFHPNLPSFIGQGQGHLPGNISGVKRGREDDIMALPFSHPLYSVPFVHGPGSSSITPRDNARYGSRGRTRRTSSGWWRHTPTTPSPNNRRPRPLYQRRQHTRNRNGMCMGLGIRVPPTTGTPLDSAYSLAYMQEETPSQIQSPQPQRQPQRQQYGQEEYEMEDNNKGRQAAAAREETPPPPYKARRSSEDIHVGERPPGCLCGRV
ncbi:hypothetical protein B0T20DRAFT_396845 [Sordaria brevicollis]|uniref:Uncharacterized protein n=1 Tax=Sordaria brevicollis TaxID=83679 RepID=A0AAE0U563_SORBR|nr:hypothetical protein B0T20DRAFT_396845 [Sordaria brevicollis]